MTDELARILDRVRQSRTVRTEGAALVSSPGGAAPPVQIGTAVAGDRVFDVQTGQLGTVTGAGLLNQLARDDVRVSLDSGPSVIRAASAVIRRPKTA